MDNKGPPKTLQFSNISADGQAEPGCCADKSACKKDAEAKERTAMAEQGRVLRPMN
jgi:hypothetical protein